MFVTCWSVKGGSGTTVVAAGLSTMLARRMPTWCLDYTGDVVSLIGVLDELPAGLVDWASSNDQIPAARLRDCSTQIHESLRVIPRGSGSSTRLELSSKLHVIKEEFREEAVVLDIGVVNPYDPIEDIEHLASVSDMSICVLRPCYMALQKTLDSQLRPDGLIVVDEPGRVISPSDLVNATGIPLIATIPWDAAIARAADTGAMGPRVPKAMEKALAKAA